MLRKPAWSGDLTWWSVVDASDLESSSFWPLFALNGCDTVYNCEKAFCVFLLALIVSPHLATVGPDTPGGGQWLWRWLTDHWGGSDIFDMFLFLHPPDQRPIWAQSIAKSRGESVFHLSCKICKFQKEFTLEKPTHLPPLATASNPTKLRGQKVGAGAEKVGGRLLRVGLRALRGEVISSVALYKPHQMQPSPLYTLLTTDMDRLTRKTQASAWFSNAQTSNF